MSNQLEHAKTLEQDGRTPEAIQAYEDVIRTEEDPKTLAYANFRLGQIYQEWNELFAAQRFLSQAHSLDPNNSDIRNAIDSLNQHFSQNREEIADQMSRQNSDQIVSLFRIATGIKLIGMGKSLQAYPLMKSRTKIFPNAAVAKHLLTDISITEQERNSAIEYLIERNWLVNTNGDLYSISDSGLYIFYMMLGKLHFDEGLFPDAIQCYDEAHWVDGTQLEPLYHKVICYAELGVYEGAIPLITELPAEIPDTIDKVAYYTAVAESCHFHYQLNRGESYKQMVIDACEEVLRIDKKDKSMSKLLAFYQGKGSWWRKV